MRLISILVIAAGAAAAQSYTITSLSPAGSQYHFINIIGLNNSGQVLGDTCVNGTGCTGVNRFPAVWSNGVITPLPIPAGYSYLANLQVYKINNSGSVVGTVQDSVGNNHVLLWEGGSSTEIEPPATLFPGCSGTPSNGSWSLNTAGHVLIFSAYPNGSHCTAYWIYPVSASPLTFPPPQCTGPEASYVGSPQAAMNDADQVAENVLFCGPIFSTYNPAILEANGSFSFLPTAGLTFDGNTGAEMAEINNLGDVHGFESSGSGSPTVVVWDSNGSHTLGPSPSGAASLNNAGQVLYAYGLVSFPTNQWAIWQNGVSAPINLPTGLSGSTLSPTGGVGSFNDAGQFTAYDPGFADNYFLMTPSGACAQDVTSQVQVTRGGFRLNHATSQFNQTVTVTNTGGSSIAGPISLALDNVPANATLFGIAGATLCDLPKGSPYMNIAAGTLAPNASVTGTIAFIDTANTGITYNVRVLAGAGGR